MNLFVNHIITNLLSFFELAVLSGLEFRKMDFRHNALLRCFCCLSLGIFFAVFFAFLQNQALASFSMYFEISYQASLYFLLLFSCVFLLSASNTTRLFSATVILLGKLSLKSVLNLFDMILTSAGIYLEDWHSWCLELILFFFDAVYLYEIFMKNYRGRTEQVSSKFVYVFLSLFVFISLIFETTFALLSRKAIRYSLFLSVIQFLYIVLMTFFLLTMMKQEENNTNISILKQMWNEDRKQYQIQKESMEIINIKCHDLKHQLQNLREVGSSTGMVSSDLMKQLEGNIDIYDSVIKTGNEVLDVILSNVALRASKKGIQLTSMVDGTCLSFLEEGDTYSLIGNMLDNAMEYEDTISDKKDCFISLTIKKANQMAHIHCENYYCGKDVTANGKRPMTSKQDKKNHGYGIRSMEQMVSKYNGQFDIVIADNMFQVDVLIPIPARGGRIAYEPQEPELYRLCHRGHRPDFAWDVLCRVSRSHLTRQRGRLSGISVLGICRSQHGQRSPSSGRSPAL